MKDMCVIHMYENYQFPHLTIGHTGDIQPQDEGLIS